MGPLESARIVAFACKKRPIGLADNLVKVEIKRVIGPTQAGSAVLLGNDEKTFVIFIGLPETAAIMRELKEERAERPQTHDLVQSIFLGFDLGIKQVIVSKIVDNAFCATLILEQKITDSNGEWVGRRNEVRIDARPSDCLVLALKNRSEILVTDEVFNQVQDFSQQMIEEEHSLGAIEGIQETFRPRGEGFRVEGDEEDDEDSHDDDL